MSDWRTAASVFHRKVKRETPLEVKFYSPVVGVAETYPVVPARKVIPDWWRKMPHDAANVPNIPDTHAGVVPGTVRRCPGILQLLTTGWVLPLWTDFIVTEANGQVTGAYVPPGAPPFTVHVEEQRPGMPVYAGEAPVLFHFEHTWAVQTPPGYSLRIDPMPYEVAAALVTVPGIMHADMFHQLNPIVRYRLQGDGRHEIPAGTPLCHLTLVRRADENITVSSHRDEARYDDLVWRGKGGVGPLGARLVSNSYRNYMRSRLKSP